MGFYREPTLLEWTIWEWEPRVQIHSWAGVDKTFNDEDYLLCRYIHFICEDFSNINQFQLLVE